MTEAARRLGLLEPVWFAEVVLKLHAGIIDGDAAI